MGRAEVSPYRSYQRCWHACSIHLQEVLRVCGESKGQKRLGASEVYHKEPVFEAFGLVRTVQGDYSRAEEKWFRDSLVILIFGKRGSGKSALGFKLLENIRSKSGRPCFALDIAQEKMPFWIKTIGDIEDASNGGVILVDEGAISFGARKSMSAKNRDLSELLAIARHKDLTLVFITQNTGMIDKNVLRMADMLFIKEGSLLQQQMERGEMKEIYGRADECMDTVTGDKRPYVYMIDCDHEGLLTSPLPSFWTQGLSKNQADASVGSEPASAEKVR
jgi:hypothetical protein